ncbi:hypothetical protein RB195_004547 [Necator americanus]|uniref:Uncharacterized protein n=2 Tax=Necator americanus TaxID=51031 RepID=A0ABR1BIJ4_NECAM
MRCSYDRMGPTAQCAICLKEKSKHKMRLSPAEQPFSIIFLSSLARHRIDVATAIKLYEEWHHTRQHICIAHYVEIILFLGRELRQLLGVFPVNGLADVPENVMDDFVAHIRMYGTLLGHGMCLEKKHVSQFYGENWSKYHKDILKKVRRDKKTEDQQREFNEDIRAFITASSSMDQPCTSSNTAAVLASTSTDLTVPHSRAFDQFDPKPSTSYELSTSAMDLMGLLSASMTGLGAFPPFEEDSWRLTTCALCGVQSPELKLRRPPEFREYHLLLLSGLVMSNAVGIDVACHVYKDSSTRRTHYCKHHFVQAALCFGDEARKVCGQFPVRDFLVPIRVQSELLERIREICAKVDGSVVLSTDDLVRFYTDCQTRYYEEERWRVLQPPAEPIKSLGRSRKRNNMGNVQTNEESQQSGLPNKQSRIACDLSSSGKDRYCVCLICGMWTLKTECRINSSPPDQIAILLCCLVVGYGLPLDLARIIYQEMGGKNKRVCKRHYVQAGIHICYEIQTIWGQVPPRSFNILPCYIRLDLVKRFHECAGFINDQQGLTEEHLMRFYNDWQVRYRKETGWVDDDLWQFNEGGRQKSIAGANFLPIPWERRNNDLPQFIPEQQRRESLRKGMNELNDEHLEALQRCKCCICGEIRLIEHTGLAEAKDDQALLLLCCLVLHDQLSVEIATALYASCKQSVKRICHEHLVFVGGFLRAEYETRYGECTPNSLLNEPKAPKDELFARLVEISKQINIEHCLQRTSLSVFYSNFLSRYCVQNRNPKGHEKENDSEQDIYLCENTGVEENPFCPDEQTLKSELLRICGFPSTNGFSGRPENPQLLQGVDLTKQCEIVHEQSSAFTSSKDENTSARTVQYQTEVLNCSQGPSTSDQQTSHGRSDHAREVKTSHVADEKSSFCIEVSAADLLQQGVSCSDATMATNVYDTGQYPFEEFDDSSPSDQQGREANGNFAVHDNDLCSVESSDSYYPSVNTVSPSSFGTLRTSDISTRNGSAGCNLSTEILELSDEIKIMDTLHRSDPNKSVVDLASELGISTATLLSYLRSKDAILNETQLQCRLEICSALSLRNSREPFLSRIITYGEKVLCFEDRKRLSHLPVDAAPGIPSKKILLTVWWSASGLICHQFVRGDFEKMSVDRFSKQIAEVHRRIAARNSELANGLGPVLICDNPCPHITRVSTAKMYQCGFEILPYPSHAKDLLPSHYYFFQHLFKYMEHKDYANYLEMAAQAWILLCGASSGNSNGFSEVSSKIMDEFTAQIKTYETALRHNVRLEKKDVVKFYDENWSKYRKEIQKLLRTMNDKEKEQKHEIQEVQMMSWSYGCVLHTFAPSPTISCSPLKGMVRCALCGNERSHASSFTNASELSSTIILLSCLTKYNTINENSARKLYNDMRNAPQRICKGHYIEAIKFLRKEIEELWNDFPLNKLEDVPYHVIDNVIENMRPYCLKLDTRICGIYI